MYFRSTGLGKTELTGSIADLKRQGDHLVMYVDVTQPVKWRIRGALSFKDLFVLLKVMLRVSILGFILNPKQWFNKAPKHPGEF
ncbi:MAG: hypothetical protein FJY85_17720 [Deltaproteobacteria bacterium]|nr:hypothetical protein [Deltaproteobacteria bacterium]